MRRRLAGLGLVAVTAALVSSTVQHAQQPAGVDFARDVQPILRQNCYSCHGAKQQKNGLRLDRRKDAMRGGTIAVIGRGNADGSRLYQRLIGDDFGIQMPPTGALPPEQIAIIKRWIDDGADWPDALAGDVPETPVDPGAAELMESIRLGQRDRVRARLGDNGDVVAKRGPGGATRSSTSTP